MHTGETWRLGRRPALDGLRGVAVLLVVGYHAVVLGGGHLAPAAGAVGVAMFFTLSGFLITSLLLDELEERGRIDMWRFYVRRALRLVPALIAVIAACGLVTVFARPGFVHLDSATASLFYVQNWWGIAHVGGRDALNHTWSLAIEEQFYLLWPAALVVLARLGHRWMILAFAVVGSLAAVLLREWLWVHGDGAGGWRIYAGSDTRADGLLLGCALAVGMRQIVSQRSRPAAVATGFAGIAVTINMLQWGYLVVAPLVASVCTLAVIFGAAQGSGSRLLQARLLGAVGRRSYGLYLWHAPLIGLMPHAAWPMRVVLFLGFSFALTALSWRYVEQPFMRLGSLAKVGRPERGWDVTARVDGATGRAAHLPVEA